MKTVTRMKPIDEIKAIPRIRMYMPTKDSGVARFKLDATTHKQLARIVFSWHSGMDVVQVMFKQRKRVTAEEIAEVISLFFHPAEAKQCEVIPHPDNDLVAVIYRAQ